jgi:uracil-DNA glycosylase
MIQQTKLDLKAEPKLSPKLIQQLGNWTELYPFFESPKWTALKEGIKPDLTRTIPYVDNWFKAFRLCPPQKLKVVWIGMSPYYSVDNYTNQPLADGLAFSTDPKHSVPATLFKLYKGMEEDLWNGLNLNMARCNNLEYLADQGVLLINAALTTVFGDSKVHIPIWKPFTSFLMKHLNDNFSNLVITGFGDEANQTLVNLDRTKNCVIELEHPVRSSYEHRNWKHKDVFSRTNDYLTANNKGPILWDKSLVDMEVPF